MSGHPAARPSLAVALVAAVAATTSALTSSLAIPNASGLPPAEWLQQPLERWLVQAAGVALAVAAVGAAWLRGQPWRGPAAAIAVLAAGWPALALALWAEDAVVRGAALVIASLQPAALLHLAATLLAVPAGRWLGVAYGAAAASALLLALTRDPLLDPGCVVRCGSIDPPLAVPGAAALLAAAVRAIAGACAAAACAMAVAAGFRARELADRAVALPLAALCGAELWWVLGPTARATVGPAAFAAPAALDVRAALAVALAVALIGAIAARARRSARLGALADEIIAVTPPASVRDAIARRLGDPAATLAFDLGDGGGWVDERGEPRPESGRAATLATVRRDGRPIARIGWSAAGAALGEELERALGPATALALDAARTHAESLHRLADLRAARRAEVLAADDARRRAERDLHDGAQHLLLAAVFALRDAQERSLERDDADAAAALEQCIAEVSAAAERLRAVAHGMYPVLLSDAGLTAALESLARSANTPTSFDARGGTEVEAACALTAYRLADRATIVDGADRIRIRLSSDDRRLELRLDGARLAPADARAIADRARALGGRLRSRADPIALELPCG
ncbi:sensor histidine kinase [Agrococcus carbonis]|uniref:Histidine kinase n=1 Tax=Agrococcus carbonis TaxID=684552 RepID=A0A1H1SST5_9MICO|nr:histidine kinase [Agrococcus carbonis]SDS50459.1 Histidine kinase [Agrococcus carbonis]